MLHRHASAAVAVNYTAGAIAGAGLTASGLVVLGGLASPVPAHFRMALAASGLVLVSLEAFGLVKLALPYRPYQIPRQVFHTSPAAAARRFAFELGTGVRTYITNPSPYGVALVAVGAAPDSPWSAAGWGVALAMGFGLGRSVVIATDALTGRPAVEPPAAMLRLAGLVGLAAAALVLYSAWAR